MEEIEELLRVATHNRSQSALKDLVRFNSGLRSPPVWLKLPLGHSPRWPQVPSHGPIFPLPAASGRSLCSYNPIFSPEKSKVDHLHDARSIVYIYI